MVAVRRCLSIERATFEYEFVNFSLGNYSERFKAVGQTQRPRIAYANATESMNETKEHATPRWHRGRPVMR